MSELEGGGAQAYTSGLEKKVVPPSMSGLVVMSSMS